MKRRISMIMPRQRARHRASSEPSVLGHPDDELGLLVTRLRGEDPHDRPAALRELGALADAHAGVRRRVVADLCAYLREPWELPPVTPPGAFDGLAFGTGAVPDDVYEPELRRLALAMIADHLRHPDASTTWCGSDLDLSGAVLTGADFSGCWFTGGRVRLEGAWCVEGVVSFSAAHIGGGHVSLRHWTSGQGDVDFSGARFTGGTVSLAGAVLDTGRVSFAGALVDGGDVNLTEARLSGATLDLTGLTVTRGTFSLSDLRGSAGRIRMVDARLLGGTTALRDADLAPGMLALAGAQAAPGALLTRGARGLT